MKDFKDFLKKNNMRHKDVEIFEIKFLHTKTGVNITRKVKNTNNFKGFMQWCKYRLNEIYKK